MKALGSFFSDVLMSAICAAGFCLCLFLFRQDLNAAFSRKGERPVGTISFRYNIVQRRFFDRVLWDRLRNESPVYQGDLIRTADLSEATITFPYGDIVDLDPNTLIQIFVDDDTVRIDFSGGGIGVNTLSGMSITSGDNLFTVDACSVLRAAALKDGALDFAVSEGAAFYGYGKGKNESRIIMAGDTLLVNKLGEVRDIPRAVATFPPPGARFISQSADGFPLEFTWNTIQYPPGGLTRLEVARDRKFKRLLFSENTSDSRLSLTLPGGTWYWRLYPLAESGVEVPYSKITVVTSLAPVLVSPQQGQAFRFYSRLPSPRFQWTTSEAASAYILEIADNPLLQNPAVSLNVRPGTGDRQSVLSSLPKEGVWYWRVTPVYGRDFSGSPASSSTGSFVIERGAEMAAPALTAPADDAMVNIETGRQDILFSWKKENEAVSYTLTISANKNMSSPVIEQTLTDTFYRYGADETVLGPGVWYWTVRQTGTDGGLSPASPPRTINIMNGELVQRPVFPPDGYTVADNLVPDMRFTWKTNLENTRFQLSSSANFARLIINEPAAAQAYTVYSLRAGVYYWRITGGIGTQRLESQSRRLIVADSLPSPELRPPQSGSSAAQNGKILIQKGKTIDFSWKPSEDAEYYTFKLYQKDKQPPIVETTVFDTNYAVSMDNFEDDAYTWTVQAFAREKSLNSRRTGLASTGLINARHLRPVSLDSPRSGWEYPGLNASRNPGAVKWSSQESPVKVRFVLARDAAMTNIVDTKTNVSKTVSLPRLSEGDYYWTIHAETADGFDISAAAPFRFRVLPIPLLPAPQNRLPADGHVIGPEEIRASQLLSLSWNPVQGANGYILTVFQGSGAARETKVQTPVLNETTYTIDNIRQLGRGDLFWQVEALYVMRDGFIEQRGRLQENRFTIDIPTPSQTRTLDTGTLYGR
jgi:hypothetical protein